MNGIPDNQFGVSRGPDLQAPPVLEAVGLQKTYGRRRVVDGVNLTVGKAEIVGLLGPNGEESRPVSGDLRHGGT